MVVAVAVNIANIARFDTLNPLLVIILLYLRMRSEV